MGSAAAHVGSFFQSVHTVHLASASGHNIVYVTPGKENMAMQNPKRLSPIALVTNSSFNVERTTLLKRRQKLKKL
jgi:hypothetical protein